MVGWIQRCGTSNMKELWYGSLYMRDNYKLHVYFQLLKACVSLIPILFKDQSKLTLLLLSFNLLAL